MNNKNILNKYPDVLNIDDLCTILSASKKTIYKLLKDKTIKSFKVGRSYRVPKTYLLDYFEEMKSKK